MDEIQREFNDLCAKAGHAAYQEALFKQEKETLLGKVSVVNQEALKRRDLDKAAQAAEENKEPK
jgi:hypothetical protein